MSKNTKNKGNIGELSSILLFKKNGYQVSLPFGDNCPYDFLAESVTGKIYRIQVRSAEWNKRNALGLRLRNVSKNYTRVVDFNRIDAFVLFDGLNHYIIDTSEVKDSVSYFHIRRELPKNGQVTGIHWAKNYLEDFSKLP